MTVITCEQCGKRYSDDREACPWCGAAPDLEIEENEADAGSDQTAIAPSKEGEAIIDQNADKSDSTAADNTCPISEDPSAAEESKAPNKKKLSPKAKAGIAIGIAAIAVITIIVAISMILPSQHYQKGMDSFNGGNLNEAVDEFESAGKYKDAEAMRDALKSWLTLTEDNDLDEATGYISLASSETENRSDTSNNLIRFISGEIAYQNENYDEADNLYSKLPEDYSFQNISVLERRAEIALIGSWAITSTLYGPDGSVQDSDEELENWTLDTGINLLDYRLVFVPQKWSDDGFSIGPDGQTVTSGTWNINMDETTDLKNIYVDFYTDAAEHLDLCIDHGTLVMDGFKDGSNAYFHKC